MGIAMIAFTITLVVYLWSSGTAPIEVEPLPDNLSLLQRVDKLEADIEEQLADIQANLAIEQQVLERIQNEQQEPTGSGKNVNDEEAVAVRVTAPLQLAHFETGQPIVVAKRPEALTRYHSLLKQQLAELEKSQKELEEQLAKLKDNNIRNN
jgi:hypothetical protein